LPIFIFDVALQHAEAIDTYIKNYDLNWQFFTVYAHRAVKLFADRSENQPYTDFFFSGLEVASISVCPTYLLDLFY
jgi:hypothetical protein